MEHVTWGKHSYLWRSSELASDLWFALARWGTWCRTPGSKWMWNQLRQERNVSWPLAWAQGCVTSPMGPLRLNWDAGEGPGDAATAEQRRKESWWQTEQAGGKKGRDRGSFPESKTENSRKGRGQNCKFRSLEESWDSERKRNVFFMQERSRPGSSHPLNANRSEYWQRSLSSQALCPAMCTHSPNNDPHVIILPEWRNCGPKRG